MREPDVPSNGTLSRRRILVSGGGATLLTVSSLPGCDLLSTAPSDDPTGASVDRGAGVLEAPTLSKHVEAGELPPLGEADAQESAGGRAGRAPGVYGGTWNSIIQSAGDTGWINATAGYDQLLRWNPEFREPLPNLAESFEVSDDARKYVFHLREGLRWSDGEPFTAEDIVFAYDDVLRNDELYPAIPNFPSSG